MKRYLFVAMCVVAGAATASAQIDEPPPAPADTAVATAGAVASGKNVKRAQFTTNVVMNEPENDVDTLTTQADEVYFFTEIVGLEGSSIEHRWIYDGEVVATVPISIKGPRWRVYSTKKMSADHIGTWTVAVYGPNDIKIAEDSFVYGPEDAAAAHTKEDPEKVKQ